MASKKASDSCRSDKDIALGRRHGDAVKFEVPSSSVGLIIGKGGKQLRKIEEEAQLKTFSIKVSHCETVPDMQTVTIKGQQCKCEAAKRKIEELVELSTKRKHRDRSKTVPGVQMVNVKGQQCKSEAAKHKIDEVFELAVEGEPHGQSEFEVPSSSVGLIVGAQGKQLGKIEEETGLEKYSIHIVPHKDGMTVPDMQIVNIKGQQCKCEAAKCKIEELVEIAMKKTNRSQIEFEVPSSSVGLIVGAQGKQLRKIEEEAKLQKFSIHISHHKSKQGMQIVTIKGQHCNCEAAQRRIEDLVELSTKEQSQSEMGHSAVAGRTVKHLSFLTFLQDTDQIVFRKYNGIPPMHWKDDDLYFLEACQQVVHTLPMKDMHQRLWNYSRLQGTLYEAMENCLSRAPVRLELEARFGKVLWRSDSQRTVSDEVLRGRHKIKDLERGGKVSVEDVLGGKGTQWSFQTILSVNVLESVKASGFPVIGDVKRLDISMRYQRGLVDRQYLIRLKQNRMGKFEILEVLLRPGKPFVFDCLNLQRDLDMRIAIGCSPHLTNAQAVAEIKDIAEEVCTGIDFRDGCWYVREPPGGYHIKYARRAKHTMYLVSHQDEVHGECPYILAYYEVDDCTQPQMSTSATGGKEVQLLFMNKHHEVELWNCQWMADFAALDGKTPEEMFALYCCDPTKIKVRPKDKREVTAASLIRELDPFVACALQLALIDKDSS